MLRRGTRTDQVYPMKSQIQRAPITRSALARLARSTEAAAAPQHTRRLRYGQAMLAWMRQQPLSRWVVLGFGVAYLSFFIRPLFLSGESMQVLPTLPMMVPIGADLRETLNAASAWFSHGGSPYAERVWYPPLTYVMVLPLLWLPSAARFPMHTLVTLGAYALSAFWLPLQGLQKRGQVPLLMLVFATGAFSYGLQFHLERGQLDLIAAVLAYAAIGIFHFAKRGRPWAYVLFTLSIQVKLWPLFLAPVLIDEWRDWSGNLRRLVLLGLANLLLFFGIQPWRSIPEFTGTLAGLISTPDMVFVVNHSIQGFASELAAHAPLAIYAGVTPYLMWLQIGLLITVVGCVFLIGARLIMRGGKGFSPDLLLACTLAGLLIPVQSQDYKLVVLAGPVALVIAGLQSRMRPRGPGMPAILSTLALSVAYAATLLPTAYKPDRLIIQNNLPALMLMLVALTILDGSLTPQPGAEQQVTG